MFPSLFKRYKFKNTRRYIRLPIAWPVKCHVVSPSETHHVTATQDVSAGGIRVVMPQKVPLGHQVQMEIYVPPKDRLISVHGQVIRCVACPTGGFELGILFKEIDAQDRQILNQTVKRSHSPRYQILHRKAWWRKVT